MYQLHLEVRGPGIFLAKLIGPFITFPNLAIGSIRSQEK